MRKTFSNKSLILLIVFASALLETSAKKKIECEEFEDEKWSTYGSLKTCYMKKAIKIRKDDSLITSEPDDSVNGLAFLANKKVHFLPINIAESFPNLLGLSSWGCPIKIISRKHLKNLHKLKLLNLGRNKIEIIKKDTFKDLRSLEWIGLNQGKIKHLNAAAFDGLLKLHTVYIDRNECVDENFQNRDEIAKMYQIIAENCGFSELDKPSIACSYDEKDILIDNKCLIDE